MTEEQLQKVRKRLCPCCDGSGVIVGPFYPSSEEYYQCQWCYEFDTLALIIQQRPKELIDTWLGIFNTFIYLLEATEARYV